MMGGLYYIFERWEKFCATVKFWILTVIFWNLPSKLENYIRCHYVIVQILVLIMIFCIIIKERSWNLLVENKNIHIEPYLNCNGRILKCNGHILKCNGHVRISWQHPFLRVCWLKFGYGTREFWVHLPLQRYAYRKNIEEDHNIHPNMHRGVLNDLKTHGIRILI